MNLQCVCGHGKFLHQTMQGAMRSCVGYVRLTDGTEADCGCRAFDAVDTAKSVENASVSAAVRSEAPLQDSIEKRHESPLTPDAITALLAAKDRALDRLTHTVDESVQSDRRIIEAAFAALSAQLLEQERREGIEDVLANWFLQGGKSQFGELLVNGHPPENADDLIAEILHLVRAQLREVTERQGWQLIETYSGDAS